MLNKIGNSVQILTSDNNSIQGEVLLSIVYCLLSQYLISYSHCFSTRSYSLRDSTGGYGPESTHQPGLVCCLQSTIESLQSDRCAGAFRKHLNRYKHKNRYKYKFTKLTPVHTTAISSLYFVKVWYLCTIKEESNLEASWWMVEYCFDTFDQ